MQTFPWTKIRMASNLYNVFQGCTPYWPVNADNIWDPSNGTWKEHNGTKAATVTRKPTAHLQRFRDTFKPVPDAGIRFTVYQRCSYLGYVLRQDHSGLVIMKVETVSENDGDDWSKTAKIRRLMPTKHALEQCRSPNDRGINL